MEVSKVTITFWDRPYCFVTGNTLGISCYQCGAEDGESALSCDIFAKAPMWRQFEVECPASPRHVCGKTITHHDDATEPSKNLLPSISHLFFFALLFSPLSSSHLPC